MVGIDHVTVTRISQRHSENAVAIAMSENPRLLFCSWHCTVDPSSGAALATRDLLELLAARGWECRVFCGPQLDFAQAESLEQLLSDQRVGFETTRAAEGAIPLSIHHFQKNGVAYTVCVPETAVPSQPGRAEGDTFLALYRRMLERWRPDVVLSYGGQWTAHRLLTDAKHHNARVVFALHNYAYRDARMFEPVDAVLVPSQFCADYYRRTLGLECTAIPSPLNWPQVLCSDVEPRYLTFVNPDPNKGVYVFARIAAELGRKRPDIPVLVVEGRSRIDWLQRTDVDFSGVDNLSMMANTPDPRDFYRVSRAVLMPSLWNESFGRVAAEAQINGIPVLGSTRGSLPEVLGDAGFLVDIPDRYTPNSRVVPGAEEVRPWVETVERLWDDPAFYTEASRKARRAAEAWRPERIAAEHDAFFRRLLH